MSKHYDIAHMQLLMTQMEDGHIYEMYSAPCIDNLNGDDYIIVNVYDGEIVSVEVKEK